MLCLQIKAAKPPGDARGPASRARSDAVHAARWSGVEGVWGQLVRMLTRFYHGKCPELFIQASFFAVIYFSAKKHDGISL